MKTNKHRMLAIISLGVLLWSAGVLSQPIHAQIATTGQIEGVVLDAQKAVMPGVEVTLRHESTGQEASVRTNDVGQYRARSLAIGRYSLTASRTGFKQFNVSGIELSANQVVRVDVDMQVGATTDNVTVSAETTPVNVTTSALDSQVESKLLSEIPLIERNILGVAALSPGVTSVRLGSGVSIDQQRINVNGNRSYSTNIMLDGATLYDSHRGQGLINPPPETVQELKVITSGVSAEFSRGSAAISAVTKSGTNELHGSLWEFFRNDALNARSFFATKVPKLRYNQFGGAAGGPIVRNKAFFFGSYQNLRVRGDLVQSSAFPPTAAERGGDFSSAQGTPPRDPLTGQPFPNRMVPVSRFDPVAVNFLSLFPLPNQPAGTYVRQLSQPTDNPMVLGKVDYDLRPGDRSSVRYFISSPSTFNPFGSGNIDGYGGNVSRQRSQSLLVSHSHTFSSSFLLTGRYAFTRDFSDGFPDTEKTLADFGAKWAVAPGPSPGPPDLQISGRMRAFAGQRTTRWTRNHEGGGDLSWLTGKHEIKFGGLVQRVELNWLGANRAYGEFHIDGSFTGNPMADFLLGLTANLVETNDVNTTSHYYSYGMYLEDNWRVSRRLSLNLGLRWEVYNPWRERDGNNLTLLPGVQSRFYPKAPLGLVFDRDPEFPYQRDAKNPGPRFGFAYDLFGNGKTSIRGGYALSYDPLTGHQGAAYAAPPSVIVADTTNVGPLSDPRRFEPVNFSQAGTFVLPVRVQEIAYTGALRTPYMQNINFTLERQVGPATVVRASYVASLGRRLPYTRQMNPAIYIPGQSTTANSDQRRIYAPAIGSIIATENGASSDYHAFQLEAVKRYSSGLLFRVSYAYAKAIDESTTSEVVNNAQITTLDNRRLDRALGDYDIRQRLVANWLWDLPVFRRSRSIAGRILGGWQLEGLAQFADGTPFTILSGVDTSLQGIATDSPKDRPDLLGDPRLSAGRSRAEQIAKYFDTSMFRLSAPGRFGSAGRNILIGPGAVNVDLSLHKAVAFSENRRLVFRWELFNAPNRPNFGNPAATLSTAASFGRITSAGDGRNMQLGLKFEF